MGVSFEFVSTFDQSVLWNDQGSGANMNGSFWRPKPNNGYFIVGDHVQSNYDKPTGMILTVKDTGGSERAGLARPDNWELVWNDQGAGSNLDGSIWRPVPPNGYVGLGCVAHRGYNAPNIEDYRCVNLDLVAPAAFGDLKWNDQGSGANMDGSTYIVQPISGTQAAIPGNLFWTVKGYGTPSDTVYALRC